MPTFRCLMRGENFPGIVLGEADPIGFYATRYVDAEYAGLAEVAALELLKRDPTLSVAPDARTKDAKVFFEEIEELAPGHVSGPNAGFSFFVMGT